MTQNANVEQIEAHSTASPVPALPPASTETELSVVGGSLTQTALPAFSVDLMFGFVGMQGKAPGGKVFAFTSARRREGVTHVVRSLGRQLAAYCREDVLIISPPDLRRLRVLDVEQIEVIGRKTAPGLWTLPVERPELDETNSENAQEDLWKTLRGRFQYILFDCGALERSGDAMALAPRIDGTVLVVRAGYTSKAEVQKAARLLSLGHSPFIGCILNQRTYPVPGFLFRTL